MSRATFEDHPRGCGENPYTGTVLTGQWITPADAGKTSSPHASFCLSTDHPRGCGENFATGRNGLLHKGSPPRMRGKHRFLFQRDRDSRITPADAGKTGLSTAHPRCCRDHPRGCGENAAIFKHEGCQEGSPPRMRGKHLKSIN